MVAKDWDDIPEKHRATRSKNKKFDEYFIEKNDYEQIKGEIRDDEEVLALTNLRDSFYTTIPHSLVVITNKRLIIFEKITKNNIYQYIKDEEIPLEDINKRTIKKKYWLWAVTFIYNTKKYRLANTNEFDKGRKIKTGHLYEIFVNAVEKAKNAIRGTHTKDLGDIIKIFSHLITQFGDIDADTIVPAPSYLEFRFLSGRRYKYFFCREYLDKYNTSCQEIADALKKWIEESSNCLKNVIHVDGIPFLGGKEVFLELSPEKLFIKDKENATYSVKLDNIVDVKIKTETEITEQERNIIARAIAGGILFGELGAIVGGLSGIPKRQIKISHDFLIINYISKEGDKKLLMFLYKVDSPRYLLERFIHKLIKEIKKRKPRAYGNDREIEL